MSLIDTVVVFSQGTGSCECVPHPLWQVAGTACDGRSVQKGIVVEPDSCRDTIIVLKSVSKPIPSNSTLIPPSLRLRCLRRWPHEASGHQASRPSFVVFGFDDCFGHALRTRSALCESFSIPTVSRAIPRSPLRCSDWTYPV